MNTKTGEIRQFESQEAARAAGFHRPLSLDEQVLLEPMIPDDRLAWFKMTTRDEIEGKPAPKVGPPSGRFKKRKAASR